MQNIVHTVALMCTSRICVGLLHMYMQLQSPILTRSNPYQLDEAYLDSHGGVIKSPPP